MGGFSSGTLAIGQATKGIDDPSGTQGGAVVPGPIGLDGAIPMGGQRIVAKVVKDWDPPKPRTTPEIVVGGKTLADAGRELDKLSEWGEGGGMLRTDSIPAGNSTDLTVKAHANLVHRLPRWTGYGAASTAAKAEWDRMVAKLKAHEDRHMEIAIEEADRLARDLVGVEIGDIADMVTEANRRMAKRQQELDTDTQNGSKPGVAFGDVTLDISIK
jgi:hypothetical protein